MSAWVSWGSGGPNNALPAACFESESWQHDGDPCNLSPQPQCLLEAHRHHKLQGYKIPSPADTIFTASPAGSNQVFWVNKVAYDQQSRADDYRIDPRDRRRMMVFNLETPVKNPTLTLGVMMFSNWSLLTHIFSITLEAKLMVKNK